MSTNLDMLLSKFLNNAINMSKNYGVNIENDEDRTACFDFSDTFIYLFSNNTSKKFGPFKI